MEQTRSRLERHGSLMRNASKKKWTDLELRSGRPERSVSGVVERRRRRWRRRRWRRRRRRLAAGRRRRRRRQRHDETAAVGGVASLRRLHHPAQARLLGPLHEQHDRQVSAPSSGKRHRQRLDLGTRCFLTLNPGPLLGCQRSTGNQSGAAFCQAESKMDLTLTCALTFLSVKAPGWLPIDRSTNQGLPFARLSPRWI